MITEPKAINDYYKQELFCVVCNNLIADVSDTDFNNLRFKQHTAKVNGFDLICWGCLQKLRNGKRLW